MKFANLVGSLVVSTLALVLTGQAQANPYRAHSEFDGLRVQSESRRERLTTSKREDIKPIVINARVAGAGSVRISLGKRIHKTWISTFRSAKGIYLDTRVPVLFQGQTIIGHANLSEKSGSIPTAASIIDGKLRINFERKNRSGRTRYYTLTVPLNGKKNPIIKVSSVPAGAASTKTCGLNLAHGSGLHSSAGLHVESVPVTTNAVTRRIEISTDFDAQWFERFGANANLEIAARINSADVIYQRDLKTYLEIKSQVGYQGASPYTDSDPGILLDQLRNNADRFAFRQSSDAIFLFTGKDLSGSTIGIAYVGVMCKFDNEYSYGLTQAYNQSLDYLIFAHELGHVVKMGHTTNGDIMNSSLNGSTFFSASSISVAEGHMDANPLCLSLSEAPPQSTPTATPVPATPTPTPTAIPTATSTPTGDQPLPPPPPPNEDPNDPEAPTSSPILLITSQKASTVYQRVNRRIVKLRQVTIRGALFDGDTLENYDNVNVKLLIDGQATNLTAVTKRGSWTIRFRLAGRGSIEVQAQATVDSQTVVSDSKTVRKTSR